MKNKPKVVKKITDKQRLDWLTDKMSKTMPCHPIWKGSNNKWLAEELKEIIWFDTPRQAIDAAMKGGKG